MIVKERCCPQCGAAMYSKPIDGFIKGDRPPYAFECSVCGRTEFYSADNLLIWIPGEMMIDVSECARCNECRRIPEWGDEITHRLRCDHPMAGWDRDVFNMEVCPKKQYVVILDKAVPEDSV